MNLILTLKSKYKVVSIVGLAKNAGKTTALNFLIEEAIDESIKLGITSTGRDGENTDVVTATEKPSIFVAEGTILSVSANLYEASEADLEIIKMTEYQTPFGPILICKAISDGDVQVTGPMTVSEHKSLCSDMLAYGAELILIDGAIDRKSVAAPTISDSVVISTGAVISRTLSVVVEETAHITHLYGLETLGNPSVEKLISRDLDEKEKILIVDQDLKKTELAILTSLGSGALVGETITTLDERLKEEKGNPFDQKIYGHYYVYVPGAFTESFLQGVGLEKLKEIHFVVQDATKIFIEAKSWQRLLKKGLNVHVIHKINVAAVTVNPFSPMGYSFNGETLMKAMKASISNVPIINVQEGGVSI